MSAPGCSLAEAYQGDPEIRKRGAYEYWRQRIQLARGNDAEIFEGTVVEGWKGEDRRVAREVMWTRLWLFGMGTWKRVALWFLAFVVPDKMWVRWRARMMQEDADTILMTYY